jgi:hypothetical protein
VVVREVGKGRESAGKCTGCGGCDLRLPGGKPWKCCHCDEGNEIALLRRKLRRDKAF